MFPVPLPTELALLIVSHLPISSIRSLLLTGREWLNFINQNRTTVYRNAAFVEGYMARAAAIDELVANPDARRGKTTVYSQSAMKGVQEWRDFCKRRKMIERSWAGRATSRIVPSPRPDSDTGEPAHYKRVHRIKVDENAGITIATTQLGGLVVRDLESDAVLWELPTWYVRAYAHLEYGEGYMVFDREDGNKEVWRRTAEIGSTDDDEHEHEPEVEARSSPDGRQEHVVNYILRLTRNSNSNSKARFTPHAVLHMPEITRAYRFVFPTLLVASLERAYLVDVRTGVLVQMLSGIQVVNPPEADEQASVGSANNGAEQTPDLQGVLPTSSRHSPSPPPDEDEGIEDDEDDFSIDSQDEGVNQPARFLGLVRYVDLSERHVFFAGRYLLRIFSRKTGKCVMDIPSTRWRYGKWRWEIASRESVGDNNCDSYRKAKNEGREVVRMPTRFSLEQHSRASKIVIDQFIAVHVSSDGKHVVAMLSGSRLVVMHNFETFLNTPVDPLSISKDKMISTATIETTLTSSVATTSQVHQDANPSHHHKSRRQRIVKNREARASLRRAKDAKDEEIFEHTIDVQLGAPAASSSIYLAYENGRIGVVTTNAVYIVIPPIPPPPSTSTPISGIRRNITINVPSLDVLRLPFFSNPSWLSEISCLMMSDTGLYLNWNPTWPLLFDDLDEEAQVENTGWESGDERSALISSGVSDGAGSGNVNGEYDDGDEQAIVRSARNFKAMRGLLTLQWEREYEKDLVNYEKYEDQRYHSITNGDMFVTPQHRELVESEVSTIYRVDFVPISSGEETQ